jgi:hypothetical protein
LLSLPQVILIFVRNKIFASSMFEIFKKPHNRRFFEKS